MVRFSDILGGDKKGREKDERPEGAAEAAPRERDTGDALQDFSDPFTTERYGEKARAYHQGLLKQAREMEERVRGDQGLSHGPVLSMLQEIVEADLLDRVYEYAISVGESRDVSSHSVCVSLGAMKLGTGLSYDKKSLLRLGLAAFLENAGMYKIPEAILEKAGKLSRDEMEVVRRHPETSARILREMGDAFGWLAEVASQVHERSDGSGYPRGLEGDEITEAASIIGLMDTYVAMVSPRPYREKIMESEAVRYLISRGKGLFPRKVLRAFVNQISVFPVNSLVRLNNKSIGRVIHAEKDWPLRPVIEVIYDGLGQRLEKGDVIPLNKSTLLHIVETIDEREFGLGGSPT